MKKNKILLVEPKRSKKYHTQYPPLGLLKLSAYYKSKGNEVLFTKGMNDLQFKPNKIFITSLFTYAWEPVHEVIRFYSKLYKNADVTIGGIYATLCEDHLKDTFKNRITVHKGLFKKAENILPDYSIIPDWNSSIIFSTRGCPRNCPFCAVKTLEPNFEAMKSIKHLIYPTHNKIVLWDNNILLSPYWENVFGEINELDLSVDFNQGLDARLINLKIAKSLKRLKIPIIRLAYDTLSIRKSLKHAIDILKQVGFRGRQILVYCLYNNPFEEDTAESFLNRIRDLVNWGVVSYPMRYEPLEPRTKNTYVAPKWSSKELEMIAQARRVLGYGGAFPPYEGLKKKFFDSKNFYQAFKLRNIVK